MSKNLIPTEAGGDRETVDVLADLRRFLRLCTAERGASEHTSRSCCTNAGQFVAWCREQGINPAIATEGDLIRYRKDLVDADYRRETVAVKLAAVCRLYKAIRWGGLRSDNPAASVKAPKDGTSRDEKVKFLSLERLKKLLAASKGDKLTAKRDRAILALMGVHGLGVAEVTGPELTDVALVVGTVKVMGVDI